MKLLAPLAAAALIAAAAPAHASGGLLCRTAGARPILLSLGIGHVTGAPLVSARLVDAGRDVAVSPAQWWLDDEQVRLVLVGPNALKQELLLRATRNGRAFDGNIWRGGKRRWVRCREG
jgi:hypothetical protein